MSEQHYQDGSFWHSKISDFRTCPKLYKLKHIDKIPQVSLPGGDLEFGTAMHLALNDLLTGGAGLPIFNLYWDSLKGKPVEYGRLSQEQLKDIGEVLLARFQRLHLKHFRPVSMEERISGVLGSKKVEGTPDFIGWYKDIPSIVDFKTSGSKYDRKKIECDEQMPLYAELAKRVLGFEAKQLVYLVFIKGEVSIQTLSRDLTKGEQALVVQNVIETCDDISERKTWPKNPQGCLKGSYACAYWKTCWGNKDGE